MRIWNQNEELPRLSLKVFEYINFKTVFFQNIKRWGVQLCKNIWWKDILQVFPFLYTNNQIPYLVWYQTNLNNSNSFWNYFVCKFLFGWFIPICLTPSTWPPANIGLTDASWWTFVSWWTNASPMNKGI